MLELQLNHVCKRERLVSSHIISSSMQQEVLYDFSPDHMHIHTTLEKGLLHSRMAIIHILSAYEV